MIKTYAEAYNKIINDIFSYKTKNLKRSRKASREFVCFIIKLSFEKENKYSFDLIDELLTKFCIKSDDIFIHLGSSYGQILLQIAGMISWKKILGIEYN
jgi:hypothetical protein